MQFSKHPIIPPRTLHPPASETNSCVSTKRVIVVALFVELIGTFPCIHAILMGS